MAATQVKQEQVTGLVQATNDNGIQINGDWFNFSKQRPYTGDMAELRGQVVTITWSPWSTSDGAKTYKYIGSLQPTTPRQELTKAAAQAMPGSQTDAQVDRFLGKLEPDPGLSARDYMVARMSAMKAAVHLGAARQASSAECTATAELILRWILNQAE